jgi:hypothetical protein
LVLMYDCKHVLLRENDSCLWVIVWNHPYELSGELRMLWGLL